MSCGVVGRLGWDTVLLWLWCRLAATALIGSLTWELPNALKSRTNKLQKIQTSDATNMYESQKPNSQGKKKFKRVHVVGFHLYEFLEEATLICNENADQGLPGLGVGEPDCKEAQRNFGG